MYDTKEIDLNRKVSVEAQNKTVADVLSSVFTQTDISYAMEGNNIMLMRKTLLLHNRVTGELPVLWKTQLVNLSLEQISWWREPQTV